MIKSALIMLSVFILGCCDLSHEDDPDIKCPRHTYLCNDQCISVDDICIRTKH